MQKIKFGTGGFRAVIGEGFTKETVQRTIQGLCKLIKKQKSEKPVVIGFDKRFLSDYFAIWCAEVFAGNGIKVYLETKPLPTPAIMEATKKMGNDYGIMITASHNPFQYNGIKIFTIGGKDADIEFTNELEKLTKTVKKVKTLEIEIAKKNKLVENFDNQKDYVKNILKFIDKDKFQKNKIKVLLDVMCGVEGDCANMLSKALKINTFDMINTNHDAFFNFKMPSPNVDNMQDFCKIITKGKYSFGLACDGDGDRIGLVDETGIYHNCNTILGLIYYYLIKYRFEKGDVVKNLATSNLLDKLAQKFGYKCHEVNVGFKWISSKMAETDALIGGESSGGLTMRNYIQGKDSLFSTALLLEMYSVMKKPMSKIIEEVKEFAEYTGNVFEQQIEIKNKKKFLKLLKKKSPKFSYKPILINKKDGYKYVFEDGSWALIRFSGTEPILRLFLEFPTEIEYERNKKAIDDFIKPFIA